jgi:oligo-1,6-glucosidase
MTVGETPGVTLEEARNYTDPARGELNMVFQFEHMGVDHGPGGKWDIRPWSLTELKRILNKWQLGLRGAGWNSLYLNNHDQPRMVSRFGDEGKYRKESAKMLATLLHTMQGTPYIYQGEEIGMTNVRFPSIDDYRDIETLNMYREKVLQQGEDPRKVLEAIHYMGRDNARTPMQWDDGPQAGFTTGTPWIGVNPNCRDINVKQAMADPDSIFHYYRRLIALRKQHDIMVYGEFVPLMEDHPQIYAYLRVLGGERWLVLLNFFGDECEFALPEEAAFREARLVIGNYSDGVRPLARSVALRPYEACVWALA